MNKNVGGMDKNIRIALGIILLAVAFFGRQNWAYIGIIPLITGLINFCPLYTLFGKNTCNKP